MSLYLGTTPIANDGSHNTANIDLSNLSNTGEAHFANPALTNSPYTTNRILEIPQDIKLELNNGTLTLKAGSKVYVPNGAGVFDTLTINSDKTLTVSDNAVQLVCINSSNKNMIARRLENCVSGADAAITAGFAYNTTTNQVRFFDGTGTDQGTNYSLPVAIITILNGAISSIDRVFNGFGYIGSTLFALPMKGEATTAINQDGTVTKTIWESTTIQTATVSESGVYSMSSSGVLTAGFNEVGYTKLADVTYYDSRIQNVNFYDVGFVANSNASNFSQAGRSYLSGLGMPSNRYIDLTLGASNSIYTAPANGTVLCVKRAKDVGQSLGLARVSSGIFFDFAWNSVANSNIFVNMDIRKGEEFSVYYTASGTEVQILRFYYAEGEQNV